MNLTPNPYEPPATPPNISSDVSTEIPTPLVERTRWLVRNFGLFQFVWPIAVAYWVDALMIDVVALLIASNGMGINKRSFRRFPWTALMCGVYPVALGVSLFLYDATDVLHWIPAKFSPVFVLQMVSTVWALVSIRYMVACYYAHDAQRRSHVTN